jgi:aryl-alcohol dehydrogenase (NADP+)
MRRIGSLRVSELCLGGDVLGWTADAATSEAILDAYVEGGGNFIDTADVYSSWVPGHPGGESERTIGNWLRGRKLPKLVIATKVGKHPVRRGLRPSNLRICLDGSRRRLGRETIDLYFAHADDQSLPIAEWMGAFSEMIQAGSIRHYGLSNFSADRVREVMQVAEASGLPAPVALEAGYSLVQRAAVETGGLAEAAAEFDLPLIPYAGLGAGFLTGKYARDEPLRGPHAATVKRFASEDGFKVVDTLVGIADSLSVEPATVALAWLRQRPQVVAPTASASLPEQVPALLQAMKLKLTPGRINKLDKVSAPFI